MPSPLQFKSILFDLDGTLRHNVPLGSDLFVNHLRDLGYNASEESKTLALRWEHFYFANSIEAQQDFETYKNNRKGFWENHARRRMIALGFHPTRAQELAPQISAYMADNYKPAAIVPEDAAPLLKWLQSEKYILGVVSNREETYHQELKELNLDRYFQFTLAGGEVNSYKPASPIFERALELARTAPHETMYVGDNYFADVIGARRAGLEPVLYDPNALFPEAECKTIRALGEIKTLLNGKG